MHLPFKQTNLERKSGHIFPPRDGCPEGSRGDGDVCSEGGVARRGKRWPADRSHRAAARVRQRSSKQRAHRQSPFWVGN